MWSEFCYKTFLSDSATDCRRGLFHKWAQLIILTWKFKNPWEVLMRHDKVFKTHKLRKVKKNDVKPQRSVKSILYS